MRHRNPIIKPCSAHDMFASLSEMNIGRRESNTGWDVIRLPVNVALARAGGKVLWRRLMRSKLPQNTGYLLSTPYSLAAPVEATQRQQQYTLGPFDWIVLVEAPQEPTP
jgi:hypothetical protein